MTMDTIYKQIAGDFVTLARLALTGRPQDVQLLVHKAAKRYRGELPEISERLSTLLFEAPTRASPLRRETAAPLPVDSDSRLQLLRVENEFHFDHELVLTDGISKQMQQVVVERRDPKALMDVGLHPTRTILFTGPPGVGKTMAARWIARELGRPLLILDLAAVMSSFLGRTGSNLRHVLDYAKTTECVLLLDELDALAKRRDDRGEIGELKRLVTVLLQEVDDWPSSGILVAATNHAELLDPAVWRRFEMAIDFGLPDVDAIESLVVRLLEPHFGDAGKWGRILALALKGRSHSDIERAIIHARRAAITSGTSIDDQLRELFQANAHLDHRERVEFARRLQDSGLTSQREAQRITGIARETIRKGATAKPRKKRKVAA
jgi:SpoVK/Ycf46/Vps4 family AAA+-type ATPase